MAYITQWAGQCQKPPRVILTRRRTGPMNHEIKVGGFCCPAPPEPR